MKKTRLKQSLAELTLDRDIFKKALERNDYAPTVAVDSSRILDAC